MEMVRGTDENACDPAPIPPGPGRPPQTPGGPLDPTGVPPAADGATDPAATEFEPLPDDWEERAAELTEAFIAPGLLHASDRANLAHFAHLCLRFAHLERLLQGDILCEIPAHLSVLRGDQHPTLLEEAEALAEAERSNLELPDGPIENVAELLDDRGVKVVELSGAPGRLAGAFMFGEETGPAILSLAQPGSPTGRFILAHGYCHLLADVDPYESRFCPHCRPSGEDPLAAGGRLLARMDLDGVDDETSLPETRADLFARSFLLPRDHFTRSLLEFGQGGRDGFNPQRLADVALYYGVTPQVLIGRLMDIEIVPAREALRLARELIAPRVEASGAGPSDARGHDGAPRALEGLPERFVNLALALFIKRQISFGQLGTVLGLEQTRLLQFLAWVDLPADLIQSLPKAAHMPEPGDEPPAKGTDSEGATGAEQGSAP
jgi:Zn-dependent peptidase ImmA (M78 family)